QERVDIDADPEGLFIALVLRVAVDSMAAGAERNSPAVLRLLAHPRGLAERRAGVPDVCRLARLHPAGQARQIPDQRQIIRLGRVQVGARQRGAELFQAASDRGGRGDALGMVAGGHQIASTASLIVVARSSCSLSAMIVVPSKIWTP